MLQCEKSWFFLARVSIAILLTLQRRKFVISQIKCGNLPRFLLCILIHPLSKLCLSLNYTQMKKEWCSTAPMVHSPTSISSLYWETRTIASCIIDLFWRRDLTFSPSTVVSKVCLYLSKPACICFDLTRLHAVHVCTKGIWGVIKGRERS